MKKNFLLFFVSVVFISLMSCAFASELNGDDISIYIDDNLIELSDSPILENGTTLIPMREIFEKLECVVEWDEKTQSISIERNANHIKMEIGNYQLKSDDKIIDLTVCPQIINNKTYIPLRAVSEALGVYVNWYAEIHTISILTSSNCEITPIYKYNENGAFYANEWGEDSFKKVDIKIIEKSFIEKYKVLGWIESIGDNTLKILVWRLSDNKVCSFIFTTGFDYNKKRQEGYEFYPPDKTMYSLDGRTIQIYDYQADDYRHVGWYDEPMVLLYSVNGYSYFKQSEVEKQLTYGWSTEPLVELQAYNGTRAWFKESEVKSQLSVGWHYVPKDPTITFSAKIGVVNDIIWCLADGMDECQYAFSVIPITEKNVELFGFCYYDRYVYFIGGTPSYDIWIYRSNPDWSDFRAIDCVTLDIWDNLGSLPLQPVEFVIDNGVLYYINRAIDLNTLDAYNQICPAYRYHINNYLDDPVTISQYDEVRIYNDNVFYTDSSSRLYYVKNGKKELIATNANISTYVPSGFAFDCVFYLDVSREGTWHDLYLYSLSTKKRRYVSSGYFF